MGKWMDGYLGKMQNLKQEVLQGGGEERIAVQHSLGKLSTLR